MRAALNTKCLFYASSDFIIQRSDKYNTDDLLNGARYVLPYTFFFLFSRFDRICAEYGKTSFSLWLLLLLPCSISKCLHD